MTGIEDGFGWLHGEGDLDEVFCIAKLSWRLEANSLDAPR